MAKTKAGRIYKQIKSHSNTRREYMGGVPGSRIQQYDLGNKAGDFPIVVSLVAEERVQIMHTALEATRIAANRVLTRECGSAGYHLKVRAFPHEVLRENKQASGAGADRVSQGMRAAFGKNIGTAARVEVGQPILTIRISPERFNAAKEAFRKANMKLPTPTRYIIEKGNDLVQLALAGKIAQKARIPDAVVETEPEAEPAPEAAEE